MGVFDPAAWVAEYEAIGGQVDAVRPPMGGEGRCLALTFPPVAAGRGNDLLIELNQPSDRLARGRAVLDYVVTLGRIQR